MLKPRVVYWNNQPSPYHVARLNSVFKRSSLDILGLYDRTVDSNRDWLADVPEPNYPYYTGIGTRAALVKLRQYQPDLLVTTYGEPAHQRAIPFLVASHIRVVLRVLPTPDVWFRRSVLRHALKGALFRRVDGFKVPGADGAAFVRNHDPNAALRLHYVPQTVDLSLFRPEPSALNPGSFHVVVVSRLEEEKGLLMFCEAAKRSGLAGVITIAGTGALRQRLASMDLGGFTLRLPGHVKRDSLPRLYSSATCTAFPTLGDGHGIVVEESLACGTPVISSRMAGDIRSRILDRRVGLVVESNTVDAWSDALIWTASQPDALRGWGANALAARRDISDERYADAFEDMVWSVLAGKPV